MRNFYRFAFIAAVFALCAGVPAAHAQGYGAGVVSGSGGDSSGGYSGGGVLAPLPGDSKGTEPRGYRGVIPGYVPPEPAQQSGPKQQRNSNRHMTPIPGLADDQQQQQEMTPIPGLSPTGNPTIRTVEDLQRYAHSLGISPPIHLLPPNLGKDIHIPARVYSIISGPQPRIDGMLPVEYAMKAQIDVTMENIRKISSPDDLRNAIDQALVTFNNAARGFRMQHDQPDVIYQSLGVPAIYVKETRESTGGALRRLGDAIQELQEMRKNL